MAKRASTESVAQIIDEAKRMAVTFQMKEFTDRAARELKKPTRQLKCKFCSDGHHTSECQNIPQAEKMAIAIQKKLCLTCLSPAFHLPVNCRVENTTTTQSVTRRSIPPILKPCPKSQKLTTSSKNNGNGTPDQFYICI
ncbi:unnamed protein product [Caenorhabditis nigoni]